MSSDLAAFWQTAAADLPLVIVGGGRWGRTWASVVATARGSGQGITIAARTAPDAVRAWVTGSSDLAGISTVPTVSEAMKSTPRPAVAIIASRPRDHLRDVCEALQFGLHILVEKPISIDAESGRSALKAAREAGRVLAIGTEFAYLPALHQLAREISNRRVRSVRFFLKWNDVAGEVRHGLVKARHEEVSLLTDLLPHAFSIFQIFAPDRHLNIVSAAQSEDRSQGQIRFRDNVDGRYEFRCDVAAASRRRILDIESDSISAALDFGEAEPSILIDGRICSLETGFAAMNSTLRLELGAFFAVVTRAIDTTFMISGVPALVALQEQLEQASSGKHGCHKLDTN